MKSQQGIVFYNRSFYKHSMRSCWRVWEIGLHRIIKTFWSYTQCRQKKRHTWITNDDITSYECEHAAAKSRSTRCRGGHFPSEQLQVHQRQSATAFLHWMNAFGPCNDCMPTYSLQCHKDHERRVKEQCMQGTVETVEWWWQRLKLMHDEVRHVKIILI